MVYIATSGAESVTEGSFAAPGADDADRTRRRAGGADETLASLMTH
jgi:hypothetical protein